MFFIFNKIIYKKSISPLIATILLVVVAVVLIAIVLSWGKAFATSSLDSASISNFMDFTDSDKGMFVKIEDGINGRYFTTYTPPSYLDDKNITLTHYSLFSTDPIPLEPNINLEPNTKTALDLGIVDSSFDLKLYTDSNTVISKTGLTNINRKTTGDCPEGFSFVPGNFLYDTVQGYSTKGGFCVSTYEMKVDVDFDGIGDTNDDIAANCRFPALDIFGHYIFTNEDCNVGNFQAVSTKEGAPIATIGLENTDIYDARDLCSSINGHVINMDERMTILRNIERVPENWTSGEVGVGSLYVGNTGSCVNSNACYDYGNVDYGIRSGNALTARLYFTNGEEIWDFSGNLAEWVDYTFNGIVPFSSDQATGTTGEWIEIAYANNSYPILDNYGSLSYKYLKSLDPSLSSENGAGRIFTVKNISTTLSVPLISGARQGGTNAGLYFLYLDNIESTRAANTGVRCVLD